MGYENWNQTMESDGILIWNAADDPVISPRLEKYMYTQEKFDEGKTFWKEADEMDRIQSTEKEEQKRATEKLNKATDRGEEKIKRAKRLARLAFEGNKFAFGELNLETLNFNRFEDWLSDAEDFYAKLLGNEEWVTAMGNYGYTGEQLAGDQKEIAEVRTLQQDQRREMGEAQLATEEKWDKFKKLDKFCDHLREVASIEFKDEPQHLEKLGILVRS